MGIGSQLFRWLFFSASSLWRIEGVSAPASSRANVSRTSAAFEGTKGLLLAELEERESEVRLLRRALLDLGGDGEDTSAGPTPSGRPKPSGAEAASLQERQAEAPSTQVADALLEESDDEQSSPQGTRTQGMVRRGAASPSPPSSVGSKTPLASRLFRQPDTHHRPGQHESQDTEETADQQDSREEVEEAAARQGSPVLLPQEELNKNVSIQQMVAQRVMSTERRLVDLSKTWSLAAKAATAASSAAAKEASAEAKTAIAAARAQKGLTNRLTHMAANKSMDDRGKVHVLLEASAEVARLRDTEVAKAEKLALELKKARDREAMLSNGLTKTLDKETYMLEQIQSTVNA